MQRIFIKKCFLFMVGSLSRKNVHNWVEKCGNRFTDEELETQVRKWLMQQSNDFYTDGFDALVKR
jgi:hypothetical protein